MSAFCVLVISSEMRATRKAEAEASRRPAFELKRMTRVTCVRVLANYLVARYLLYFSERDLWGVLARLASTFSSSSH